MAVLSGLDGLNELCQSVCIYLYTFLSGGRGGGGGGGGGYGGGDGYNNGYGGDGKCMIILLSLLLLNSGL